MEKRLIPKNGWKPKVGAVAGAAVVTGLFVTGSAPTSESGAAQTENIVPIAAHVSASTPIGRGYWLVNSTGTVYAYGDAKFYGDMSGKHLDQPMVGIIPAPDSKGYWLIAKDGGIFAFGSARFLGGVGGTGLRSIVGGASLPSAEASGQTALVGSQGPQGVAGTQGAQGLTGVSGPEGPEGPTG